MIETQPGTGARVWGLEFRAVCSTCPKRGLIKGPWEFL